MQLGTAIQQIRKQKGIRQGDLAKSVNIAGASLSLIENNHIMPRKYIIQQICAALNIPVAYLLLYSIEDSDIPPEKREIFNTLMKITKDLLTEETHADQTT